MNRKYKLHPGLYELGENEKFYGDMEARGWRLVKRGQYLSRFERVEPSRARYRIEVYMPAFLEQAALPEEQIAVFEDCGWEHVADCSFLHIFRAPEGSDAPEFYADPAQQAETLKKVRRDLWWGAAVMVLMLAVVAAIGICRPFGNWYAQAVKRFIQIPTHYAAYLFWLLWGIYRTARETWKINRTYRRMKKGRPMDHAPKGSRMLHTLLSRGLLSLVFLCFLLTVCQLFASQARDLPAEPDGPYIMLRDLGVEGERGTSFYRGRESSITHTRSFLADYWETFEIVDLPGGQTWMYQYVYRLRFPATADKLTWALMEDSVFVRDADSFYAVDAPGLDRAWATGELELVAVKGDTVVYVEALSSARENFDPQVLCAALARRWEETASRNS